MTRAFREANKSPHPTDSQSGRLNSHPEDSSESLPFTHYDFNQRPHSGKLHSERAQDKRQGHGNRRESVTMFAKSPPVLFPHSQPDSSESSDTSPTPETTPLQVARRPRGTQYGSFDGSAPEETPGRFKDLELPDPALTPSNSRRAQLPDIEEQPSPTSASPPRDETPSPGTRPELSRKGSIARRLFARNQNHSGSGHHIFTRSRLRKVFHAHQLDTPYADDVQLEAYQKLDVRQQEFFAFLDKELKKVEDFYKMKEDESSKRLTLLKQQLHELRDRRMDEIHQAQNGDAVEPEGEDGVFGADLGRDLMNFHIVQDQMKDHGEANGFASNTLKPIGNMISGRKKLGRTTKSLANNTSPLEPGPKDMQPRRNEDKQDYVRKKSEAPSFRVAKRRLKLALQEFYRGLELLKSYALLNRTAFRKINKKYDKAVNARPTMRYYSEKVDGAHFVKSDFIGGYMVAVEDLYARYFEKGNHKVAITKLRSKTKKGDLASTAFRNGLYLAAGTCFAISGLVTAVNRLFDSSARASVETAYLLQMYGGYFLATLLFLLFCLNCRVWVRNRINYQFIFEYDTRHTLDWRELAELPCFFIFLNGLFLWVNFHQNHHDGFYLYWPIILIAITLVIIALPFRILYYQARRWLGYSLWRLLFASLYPVEFRDFYLGDMFCSLTYTMSQIQLFFCLYVNAWGNPSRCNSSHSRLMGFFATLPAIWRAFQCLRRYKDSGNWFPHLANFAKYCCNILYYMSLSLYRVDMGGKSKAAFLVFAAINGVYCSFWDVYFDWSLGNPFSSNWLLRNRLGYKRRWIYYAAVPTDIILRHQWVLFAIFTEDVQHNSAVSFFVALAEVLRRGMWSLFRVENEHCNNVENYRASRDIPLPYKIEEVEESRPSEERRRTPAEQALSATGADLEQQRTASSTSSMRQRRGALQTPTFRALQRVGTVIAAAHAADFQRRKPAGHTPEDDGPAGHESSDDDDDDRPTGHDREDSADVEEANKMVRRASRVG